MGKYRIFATCNIGDEALSILRARGCELEVYERWEAPPKEIILEKVRSGIDALITTLRDPIDAEVIEAGKGTLKVIAHNAAGFDNIDRAAASRCRIPFTNTAEVLTHATAEFAFFMLGCAARKLFPSEMLVRNQEWVGWHPSLPFLGDEVTGKTVAVVGTGRIGRAFATKCTGFEMDILCVDEVSDAAFITGLQQILDLHHRLGNFRAPRQARYCALDEALAAADFVSLHVPLTPATRNLIDREALGRMKPTAWLVNTSRGPVVDESALVAALEDGTIAGAALDVFVREPLPADSPLRNPALSERLRIFHHFASGTRETRLDVDPAVGMAGRCIQALLDVMDGNYGGNPALMPYVVNKEAFRD